ncbi:TetR/AcrR family transcriptional regulator [Pseudooceanicola sp. CBS1P-1]|uniref:TetR family transcriptional regulator n=1 Tax=Pseudooceanicola albus TaxID=2692189 RepID=A0A6L7G2I5_9RHOB|nr:TetR/AcrR family transcriptional regulator [Pseudooceanicola endophyticus]MXN18574.1 TetR family transcriptional regulator [Pseudooceanicola albus]
MPPGGKPRRGRPRAAATPERRRQIIAAATEAFAQQGFNGASFAAIAERVGMTLPGLLHYFPRKTDLLLAILDERDRETVALIAAHTGGPQGGWAGMKRALHELCRRNAEIPEIVQMFSALSAESLGREHPARGWFETRTREVNAGLAAMLEQARLNGEIRADADPGIIATEIAATMDGLQIAWLRMPDRVDLVRQFDLYLERLDGSIRAS